MTEHRIKFMIIEAEEKRQKMNRKITEGNRTERDLLVRASRLRPGTYIYILIVGKGMSFVKTKIYLSLDSLQS